MDNIFNSLRQGLKEAIDYERGNLHGIRVDKIYKDESNDQSDAHELFKLIPNNQTRWVFSQKDCELEHDFLGFTEFYKHLSFIIPTHFTIVDLGCGYAPQSFYFTKHKQYIGVDVFEGERFFALNTRHYTKTIQDYVRTDISKLDLCEVFAICSYVPDEEAKELVRNTFPNLFVYYPCDKQRFCDFMKEIQ